MRLPSHPVYIGLYMTVILWVDRATSTIQTLQGQTYELCDNKLIRLSSVGDWGRITVDPMGSKNAHKNPCILKIESCSSCQIQIQQERKPNENFFCLDSVDGLSNTFCKISCDYLFIFDMYYMNETIRYYQKTDHFDEPFKSVSSNVFVGLCHYKNYNFSLTFNATSKLQNFSGSSGKYPVASTIKSPYFPVGYAQNHETYEYKIVSTNPRDFVFLIFEDWNVAESSALYFESSNNVGPVTGSSHRPAVISNKNELLVVFNTGRSLAAGENRDYMGFKAQYTFVRSRTSIPNTNCEGSGYFMTKPGGHIEFKSPRYTKIYYNCIWVVKKLPGYGGISLKVVRFTSKGSSAQPWVNWLEIREGLTSESATLKRLDLVSDGEYGETHSSSTGFYLRLNTSDFNINIALVYASYKEGSRCNQDKDMYMCGTGHKCIHKDLVCDGFDHCEDNSDETSGCTESAEPWDKSYQYTITIGVIVPMVISVFLIMVICLLFVMIRRCRRARLREAGSAERLRTLSEEVASRRGRRRRRHRRNWFGQRENDLPPTYDEAMQNPPGWYLNVAFGNPADPTLPCPPSYSEAVGESMDSPAAMINAQQPPGSPTSTDSSQSEVTMCSHNQSISSSSSEEGSPWGTIRTTNDGRRGRMGRHISSSESEDDETLNDGHTVITFPSHSNTTTTTAGSVPIATDSSVTNQTSAENLAVDAQKALKPESKKKEVLNKCKEGKDDAKICDDPSQFVIPDSHKPESYDGDTQRSKVTQSGSISRNETAPSDFQTSQQCHTRSLSPESDRVGETSKKQKKKGKKSKGKKSKQNSAKARTEKSENSPHEMPGASSFLANEQCNQSSPEVTCPQVKVQSEDESREEANYIDYNQTNSPRDDDRNVSDDYQMVVNVDNDNVLVVYDNDSLSQIDRNQATPPQYLLSGATSLDSVAKGSGLYSQNGSGDMNIEDTLLSSNNPNKRRRSQERLSSPKSEGQDRLRCPDRRGQESLGSPNRGRQDRFCSPNRERQERLVSPNRMGQDRLCDPNRDRQNILGSRNRGRQEIAGSSNKGILDRYGSPHRNGNYELESPNRGEQDRLSSPNRGMHYRLGSPNRNMHERLSSPTRNIHDRVGSPNRDMHDRYGSPNRDMHDRYRNQNRDMHDRYSSPNTNMQDRYGSPNTNMQDKYGSPNRNMHDRIEHPNRGMMARLDNPSHDRHVSPNRDRPYSLDNHDINLRHLNSPNIDNPSRGSSVSELGDSDISDSIHVQRVGSSNRSEHPRRFDTDEVEVGAKYISLYREGEEGEDIYV